MFIIILIIPYTYVYTVYNYTYSLFLFHTDQDLRENRVPRGTNEAGARDLRQFHDEGDAVAHTRKEYYDDDNDDDCELCVPVYIYTCIYRPVHAERFAYCMRYFR